MKIALLFSGQGAQYVGMGKELYDNYDSAKRVFDKADKVLGISLKEICFEGPDTELNKTENTQPAILTTSIAALKVIEEKGIKYDVVAGLSLGEYSAHVAAGTINFNDAVTLVKKRGSYMQEAVPLGIGAMSAVLGMETEALNACVEESKQFGIVEVANYNCPGQIVIAGEKDAVEKCGALLVEKGAKKVVPLTVSGPFHTSMMKPASEKLSVELDNIELTQFNTPIISNVNAEYVISSDEVKALLVNQVMSSVKWEESIRLMIKDGVDTFIEVGPGRALSGFLKKIDRSVNVFNVEDIKSLDKTIDGLSKLNG
ncbi:ACP S-malonyltransferase [Clostridium manihotivorum]|uniref:Malonyl CoA-acyl carrier protein transacylase n=1 Tax=Clostridium manihotivorum TaxID=2320868 RepID=A0A410DYP5_9CLOT|nr:ACP S-malonyltransferase [Clostridium manihotivorum]QAA34188.1 [acyl-carrier-protein] S-malonyltransferase [Clostridium manihotivorum]